MSLPAILEAIRRIGQAQVREIEDRASAQAGEILEQARERARPTFEQSRKADLAPVSEARARILHQARLEALRIIGDVREGLVDQVLNQTRGRLASLRNDLAYPAILKSLTIEALAELKLHLKEAEQAQLQADDRDRQSLEMIIQEMELNLVVTYDLNCWGGVIARSPDDRIVVINTLEARLERATPYLRRYLAAWFEGQPSASARRPLQLPERA